MNIDPNFLRYERQAAWLKEGLWKVDGPLDDETCQEAIREFLWKQIIWIVPEKLRIDYIDDDEWHPISTSKAMSLVDDIISDPEARPDEDQEWTYANLKTYFFEKLCDPDECRFFSNIHGSWPEMGAVFVMDRFNMGIFFDGVF